MSVVQEIEINKIDFNDKAYIFRHSFNVRDLENSIQYEGLLYSPILIDKKDGYTIVCGYRRLMACKNLSKTTVKCIVYQKDELDKDEFLKISIAENTKRQNLKPVEIAEALLRIKKELDLSDRDLAEQFGETFNISSDENVIKKYLKLNLFDEQSKDVLADSLSDDLGFTLTDVEEKEDRNVLLDLVKEHNQIKNNQLKKIIDNTQKIKKRESAPLNAIFSKEPIRELMENPEVKSTQKINSLIKQLEEQADPERMGKIQKYDKVQNNFKVFLEENNFPKNKVKLTKTQFGSPKTKISFEVDEVKEMNQILKLLYEGRNDYIKKIMEL